MKSRILEISLIENQYEENQKTVCRRFDYNTVSQTRYLKDFLAQNLEIMEKELNQTKN